MPDFSLEDALALPVIAGADEAGRGPLAGPVVAAAVVLRWNGAPLAEALRHGLDDSKRLTARRREGLFEVLKNEAEQGRIKLAVALSSIHEIFEINILRASLQAMARAIEGLGVPVDHALIDGNQPPPLICPLTCVVGGDGLSLSIAAASILAKVTRDRLMQDLARDFPGYGWERNQGYPTTEHREAIQRLGLTPHHRRGFRGC